MAVELDPDAVVDATGAPTPARVDEARTLIAGLGGAVLEATREPWAARGLIYALLLSHDAAARQAQLALIDRDAEPGVPAEVDKLAEAVATKDAVERVTLVSLAVPALKQLSEPQYRRFITNTIALIKLDRSIDLFEWVLHRLLLKDLTPHFERRRPMPVKYRHLDEVSDAAGVVLSSLARHGQPDADARQAAFAAAVASAGIEAELDTAADENFGRLNEALKTLRHLRPLAKPRPSSQSVPP